MNSAMVSFISFVNNRLSEEKVVLGMLVIDNGNVFFDYSDYKLNYVKKLNSSISPLLKLDLESLKHRFNKLKQQKDLFNIVPYEFSLEWLLHLCKYENGILNFSTPLQMESGFDEKKFNLFFSKFVDGSIRNTNAEPKKNKSHFKSVIKQDLQLPLKDKVDVDYKLQRALIPNLFFDFHLDVLGVNGAVSMVKSIDLNSISIDNAKKTYAEYESLIPRINSFSRNKGMSSSNKFYIVSEGKNLDSEEKNEFYEFLSKSDLLGIKFVYPNDLSDLASDIIRSGAERFSERFY